MNIETLYKIFLNHRIINTDSRKIERGGLFFALRGNNFDGNRFARQAIEQGAAYAIIDDATIGGMEQLIVVKDVLATLQKLANYHRKQFEIPIIGITGTNGKTTTKELAAAVLSSHYITHFTKGNFNNHIGVPLTLLNMPNNTEIAIIEMGANHIEEIDFLCQIATPTHGLITNVGEAHLEGFGSFEGVKKAKGELYRYLENHSGIAFVNLEEPFLLEMAGEQLAKIFYTKSETPNPKAAVFETKLLSINPFIEVGYLSKTNLLQVIKSQLTGLYNFDNIMTAIALGRYFKVPPQKIKRAIESYEPKNNRSQIVEIGTNKFLLDAYNANPSSMAKALEHFAQQAAPKKIAILGDMLEMGAYSQEVHKRILTLAQKLRLETITVGQEFYKINGFSKQKFKDTAALKKWFYQQNFDHTSFLLKGSRGVKLESLLEA